jgi:hypothetical protein
MDGVWERRARPPGNIPDADLPLCAGLFARATGFVAQELLIIVQIAVEGTDAARLRLHDSGEIGSLKRGGIGSRNRTFMHGSTQDVMGVSIKEFELPCIRCRKHKAKHLFKHPAWDMETLKSTNYANLEHDAITVVRNCRPNKSVSHDTPPFSYKHDSTFVAL